MYPLAQIAVLAASAEEDTGEFIQSLSIHFTLELDDGIQRHPILAPTPGIELGRIRCAQADIGIAPHHTQQKPDLFLPLVVAARIPTNEVIRNVIAQPVSRPPQYTNVFGKQADFLMQFPVHGLHRALAILDAALRELPSVFPYTFAPENLVLVIY